MERQVEAAENAVVDEPALVFDLARTIIESTCRTVLTEREISFNRNDDLLALFNSVSRNLPFLPPESSHETAARRSLEQTLSGLRTVVQGITELRNQYGFASHGSDTARAQMETVQALLVAGSADTIVGFLHGVHVRDRNVSSATEQSAYEDNQDFNNFIDENHEICTILEAEFWPSDVLFQMEPETYRLRLAEFRADAGGSEETDT